MKVFYRRSAGRVAKTEAVIVLNLWDIARILIGHEISVKTVGEAIVLRK